MNSIRQGPINTRVFILPNKTRKRMVIPIPTKKTTEYCTKCNGDKWIVCDECKHEFIYCGKCKCQGIIKCQRCNHCL